MDTSRQFYIFYLFCSELNPIELVWKDVKHETRAKNTEQKLDKVKKVVEDELKSYGAAKIKNHWQHIKK